MAKKNSTPAAPATATGTEAKTKSAPKVKEEVKVHPVLLKLFKEESAATEKAATVLVSIGELVARDNISNAVIKKTYMEATGVAESSAASQASRIRSLMKNKDVWEALKAGKVTVRAAVKSASASRVPTKQSTAKKFDMAVANLVTCGKATGQDKKTILTTVEAALDNGGVK